MKKCLDFSVNVPKRNIFMMLVIVLAMAVTTSCQKDWPELTPTDAGNVWEKEGYKLFYGTSPNALLAPGDENITGIVNIAQLFMVMGPDGQSTPNVNFVFGDGSSVIGEQIIHKYTAVGDYTLTVYVPDGPTLSGTIEISAPTQLKGDIIKLAASTLNNGSWTYTIGLPVNYIYSYNNTDGWCWVEGTTAGWPANPVDAYVLSQIEQENGVDYLVYQFTKTANGYEELIWGQISNGVAHWAYDTTSVYFHPTNTGGTFHLYLKDGEIYTEEPAVVLPGTFGDTGDAWLVRGSAVNDTASHSYSINLYLNDSAIVAPTAPELQWKLSTDSAWTTVALIPGTEYYSATIDSVGYENLIVFNFLATGGNPASTVNCQSSLFYSTTVNALALQLHAGM